MTLTGKETKVDLIKICEDNEIEFDPKATNKVFIDAIKAHADYEEDENAGLRKLSEVPRDEIPGKVIDDAGQVLVKTTSRLTDIILDNERLVEISVTDHDNSQSVEDDVETRLFSASWGNLNCPPRQERVLVNGSSQMASRGMIKHMQSLTIPMFVGDKVTRKNRFTIHELGGWTQEQLDALKLKQSGHK